MRLEQILQHLSAWITNREVCSPLAASAFTPVWCHLIWWKNSCFAPRQERGRPGYIKADYYHKFILKVQLHTLPRKGRNFCCTLEQQHIYPCIRKGFIPAGFHQYLYRWNHLAGDFFRDSLETEPPSALTEWCNLQPVFGPQLSWPHRPPPRQKLIQIFNPEIHLHDELILPLLWESPSDCLQWFQAQTITPSEAQAQLLRRHLIYSVMMSNNRGQKCIIR